MLRPFLATLAIAGLTAWAFSPAATGAPEDRLNSADERLLAASLVDTPKLPSPAHVAEAPSLETPRKYPTTKTPPLWVTRAPHVSTQRQKSVRHRGINPCLSPDPGFGNYHRWDRSPSLGQMIVPRDLELDEQGAFPLVVHFHGHEAARKEWVQAIDDAVLVGIDLGNNSGPYLRKFSDPGEFERLLASVERGVAERLGVPNASIGKLGLSSWSAGYGAVERVLRSTFANRLEAVILLDGLHTGHAHTPRAAKTLAPFVEHARRAAEGKTFMYVSHSSILPPTYASTTETAGYLMWQLGGKPEVAGTRLDDPMGLELIRQYTDGDFLVRGFSGNGKLDHCAHLGLYRRVLREQLAPRWGLRVAAD